MKIVTVIALALISATLACHADVTEKLVGGKWSGSATATSNGVVVSQQMTTVYKRYEKTGLIATTTIKANGQKLVGVSRFHKNGKVEGELKRDGAVVAVVSGSWSATNKVLTSSVKAEGLFPSFRSLSKATLTAPNNLSITGISSTGERSVGSLKRK